MLRTAIGVATLILFLPSAAETSAGTPTGRLAGTPTETQTGAPTGAPTGTLAKSPSGRLACDSPQWSLTRTATTVDSTMGHRYHLVGQIEVPTTGYGATLHKMAPSPNANPFTAPLRLELRAPAGMSAMAIATLEVDTKVDFARSDIERVHITITKPFAWGPTDITCVVAFE